MKKHLLALLVSAAAAATSHAAVGDTTWVQANVDTLSWYGNYDSTVTFPTGGSYRNIYMIVTIGKYVCPGSPTYCGDWDYTVQNFLMTPGGDTLELGRLITPYANSGAPRTPITWKQRNVYDVTDYAAQLQGSATVRLHYSGYSGGFTGNIKFAFVEGTPDRNVVGYQRLWHGSFAHGGATSINLNFPDVAVTAPATATSSVVKFNVTGHGSDNNGCCEFLSQNYHVMLNGADVATKAIWRNDCGSNQLYPQSGTWLYDRANWCPGALVNSNFHPLAGVAGGSSFNIGLNFDTYVSPGGSLGSYTTETHLLHYGAFNKAVDAGIEDIVAPTDHEYHFRQNPICTSPIVTIKNRGANVINTITFEYGVQDSAMLTYTWSGTLNQQEVKDIDLPAPAYLSTMSGGTGTSTFIAKIISVNGAADADVTNDRMTSTFKPTPKWESKFRIQFKPNNQTVPGGTSETEWKIYDQTGAIVKQRTGNTINTIYTDTVELYTGCYKLEVNDGGCDGLRWWVYVNNPGLGVNSGYFYVRRLSGSPLDIPLNGYVYSGTYQHDFGCNFTQYFYIDNPPPSRVVDINASAISIEAYPNPASNMVNVDLGGMTSVDGTIHVIDALGRIVKSVPCKNAHTEVVLNGMANGVYTVLFADVNGNKLQSSLVVAK
jgi:hypothetical protein